MMKTQTKDRNPTECYLRERQLLEEYLPFSASTLWRMVRKGTFPPPVRLGPAITAWRMSQVSDWLNHPPAVPGQPSPTRSLARYRSRRKNRSEKPSI
jgi:predicted DNA-binding transcriptional regulator AlpA